MAKTEDTLPHAANYIIDGTAHIPKNLKSDPRFIVPDAVVEACVKRYGLATPHLLGMDPLCGIGTMLRVIERMGGRCDGIEIDDDQCAIARTELPNGVSITQADSLTSKIGDDREGKYDYIYTSIPFIWFKDYPNVGSPDPRLGPSLWRMLKPTGILIVDCDDIAIRDGQSWPLAWYQKDYFEKNGFKLDESLRFELNDNKGPGDSTFTELKFTKLRNLA